MGWNALAAVETANAHSDRLENHADRPRVECPKLPA
jgi:hypothetical protein